MSNYLNYYEIQHIDNNFEDLIHYLQDAVKENKLQITKEVVDTIIEIVKNKELDSDDKDRYYDEGYEDGEREGKEDGYADGYDEGHSDGYEEAKAEFSTLDVDKVKREYYRKGYSDGFKLFENKDIAPDDLQF